MLLRTFAHMALNRWLWIVVVAFSQLIFSQDILDVFDTHNTNSLSAQTLHLKAASGLNFASIMEFLMPVMPPSKSTKRIGKANPFFTQKVLVKQLV